VFIVVYCYVVVTLLLFVVRCVVVMFVVVVVALLLLFVRCVVV